MIRKISERYNYYLLNNEFELITYHSSFIN